MKYEIRTKTGGHSHLYRYGKLVGWYSGHPTNAEYEFWMEIKRLRDLMEFIYKTTSNKTGKECDCDPEAMALGGQCSWCVIRAVAKKEMRDATR